MREPGYLAGLAVCAILLTLATSGCGTGSLLSSPPPEVKLAAYAGSDWQAGDLAAAVQPVPGGWELTLTSTAAQPARTVLVEATLPPGTVATEAELLVSGAEMSLVVTSRPGVLAAGLMMPEGEQLAPGPLLRAKLTRQPSGLKTAAKVPVGLAGQVPDLSGVEDGVGGWVLTWGYYNAGDYDQNSEANITDLSPLGGRLHQSTLDGNRDGLDKVLDGDNNTEVNAADLTPLGANYLSKVGGYNLYRADGPDLETAASVLVKGVPFDDSSLPVDARRLFHTSLSGADLVAGAYYYVRPYDAEGGQEGPASGVLQYIPTVNLTFRVPPPGNHVVDTGQCQNPSLVLMPAIQGVSEADAPVIIYSTLGGGGGVTPLKLAYYGEHGWTTREIGGGDNWGPTQALWLPDPAGTGPGTGLVVGYDINALKVVDRRFNEQWEQTGGSDVGSSSGAPLQIALDRDPLTGALGVAQAYTGAGSQVQYSYSDGSGPWTSEPVGSVSDTIAGLAFRFDPTGGAPWILFTHGTVNSGSGILSLESFLEQARREGGAWTVSPVPYPSSPLAVDLSFRADGTPQLVCTAARDYTVNIPTIDPFTISLMFDVVTGEYNGTAWTLSQAFESNLNISLDLINAAVVLELSLASDVGWSKPDEFLFSQSAGSIKVSIVDYTPQDGALTNTAEYRRREDSGFYGEAGYYGGEAGRAYSWVVDASSDPVCAYVQSATITAQDILAGNFNAAGELAFWRP